MKLPQDYGPEDFLGWLQNPITQTFLNSLQDDRQAIMEAWARRAYTGDKGDQTLQLNAIGLAQVKTIDELLQNLESSADEAREMVAEKNRRG
jgi:hypothetical protein